MWWGVMVVYPLTLGAWLHTNSHHGNNHNKTTANSRYILLQVYTCMCMYYMWPDLRNPPYGIRTQFAQCVFLVAQVEICLSPDFVISMSNNPSSNCSRRLRKLPVSYKNEISLPFDPPSLYSHRVWRPLLGEIIKIHVRGLSTCTCR